MSTAHGQPGLSSEQRSTIRSTILSSRRTLEDELRRQLEKYGIYEEKKLPLDNLAHLSADELHTRKKLDAAIERELESTEGDLERSITNYVREATKTYLNRFVALKTIEVRDLVEETITERAEYGNRSYMHHTVSEIAGELTDAPDDGFGAALDLAYQEIGAEIRMIFEESEHTAIDLDAQVREEILDDLDAIDVEAWESDEALGWVYQYFGEEEREDIDDRVDEENYKISGTDIATKTQLFTPRYIVEWMVDNSLGRTWLEMQGERTNIDDEDNCFYLAPLEESLINRETKPVEDITVLDPACGSGHMLFYAFDVLYQMYLEEGKVLEKHIPREILRNNLYGIDIDSGAAQIAALSLYLKAKEKSPDVEIPQLNIVSADAVLINGDRKREVLDRARSEVEVQILEQIWQSFENIREFGSLVRVEERIDEIVAEQKDAVEESGQVKFTDDGSFATQSTFVSEEGGEESWRQVKNRLLEEVSNLASEALDQNSPIEQMFAGEVGKSVELLDTIVHEYDVVVTNPPYLDSRKMGRDLKEFVSDGYKGSRELYTAFIERCYELSKNKGHVSLVTPENFMFLYSYRGLRSLLLSNITFLDGAHLSGYSFSNKDRPFTIPFVFRNENPSSGDKSRFYRLTHEQNEYDSHAKKIDGLNEVTSDMRRNSHHQDLYTVSQSSLASIDRSPFIYWFGQEVLQLFEDFPSIGDVGEVKAGLQTGDDDRFVRCWWEIESKEIGENYFWLFIGGDDSLYYDSPEKTVYWANDGEELREFEDSSCRNTEYYLEEGAVYRDFSKHFTARIHPKNHIFSNTSRFIHIDNKIDNAALIGYLCSSVVRFIANGLNPSIHFQVGDGKRIPVNPESEEWVRIREYTQTAISIQKEKCSFVETKREFKPQKLVNEFNRYHYNQDIRQADIDILHGLIDEIVFSDFEISKETQERIYDDLPENLARYPHISNIGKLENEEYAFRDEIPTIEVSEQEFEDMSSEVMNDTSKSLREISEELEISPYTVAMIRNKKSIYTKTENEELAGRLLSYYLGEIFSRWDELSGDIKTSDGIVEIDSTSGNGLEQLVYNCVEQTIDEKEYAINKIEDMLDASIQDWLRNNFFQDHHVDEYKRRGQRNPIYWQLESVNGAYSCFLYYHDIDENTLPKLRGQYLDPRIDKLENEFETLRAQTDEDSPDKELLDRKEEVRSSLNDIKDFRDTIDEMIDDGVTVDVEKGIWENIKEWDQYEVLETGLPKLKSSYSR